MINPLPTELMTLRNDFFDAVKRLAKCEAEINEIVEEYENKTRGRIVVVDKANPRIGFVRGVYLWDYKIKVCVDKANKLDFYNSKYYLYERTGPEVNVDVNNLPTPEEIYRYHIKDVDDPVSDVERLVFEYRVDANAKTTRMDKERRKVTEAMSCFLPDNIKFRSWKVGPSRAVASIKCDLSYYKIEDKRSRRMAESIFYGNLLVYPISKSYGKIDEGFFHVLLTWNKEGKSVYLEAGTYDECMAAADEIIKSGIVPQKKKLVAVHFFS